MRIPEQRAPVRRVTALLLVAALAMSLLPAGCTGAGGAGGRVSIDYKESPADAAARLGKVLSAATTGDEARAAVYEALARTGVAVKTVDGDPLSITGDRRLTLWLYQEQANNLALDLVEHQGWTLATFTTAISEHPEGPGSALAEKAPEAFGILLREWAAEAARNPDDPSSFAPLLLAEIAKARGGRSDFTTGTITPDQVELTYFELEVLTAGAFASEDVGATSWRDGSAGSALASLLDAAASLFAVEKAYAEDPCSFIKDTWGKDADNFGRKGLDSIWGAATGKAGDWLTGKGMGDLVGGMKSLAGPMKWVNLLTNFISLYGGYSIEVKWDPSPTHWLAYDGDHGNVKLKVTATVSVRPQADDATLKCLKFAGIDKPTSDSIKNARVEWVELSGLPKHAVMDQLGGDRVAGAFVQAVDDSGNAVLNLTMSTEKDVKGRDLDRVKKDQIVIQADVTTYKPDPSKLMAAAMFGGVKGGVTEVMKGWINKWFPKRVVARIPVEWHEPNRWRGVIEPGNGTRIVFTSQGGLESIWDVRIEGSLNGEMPMTGKSAVDLTRSDAQCTIVGTGSMADDGTTFNTTASYTFTGVAIGGTPDVPTLDFSGIKMNVDITTEGGGGNAAGGGGGKVVSIPLEPYSE
ncbi:MAG: hypothetical protein Q7W16_01600 [Coriobacteriia bacterium]|nr:hypothetical protein [Coriobacteriia bacterium]